MVTSLTRGLISVLLNELAHPARSHDPRREQQLRNLFTELACDCCNGSGKALRHEEAEDCPGCDGYGFTVPTECACRVGTGEDAGQESCLYCRGQEVRTEKKEWS